MSYFTSWLADMTAPSAGKATVTIIELCCAMVFAVTVTVGCMQYFVPKSDVVAIRTDMTAMGISINKSITEGLAPLPTYSAHLEALERRQTEDAARTTALAGEVAAVEKATIELRAVTDGMAKSLDWMSRASAPPRRTP